MDLGRSLQLLFAFASFSGIIIISYCIFKQGLLHYIFRLTKFTTERSTAAFVYFRAVGAVRHYTLGDAR